MAGRQYVVKTTDPLTGKPVVLVITGHRYICEHLATAVEFVNTGTVPGDDLKPLFIAQYKLRNYVVRNPALYKFFTIFSHKLAEIIRRRGRSLFVKA